MLEGGTQADLIEVKSGSDDLKHSVLRKIMDQPDWKFGRKIVFCKSSGLWEEGIEYLPWYGLSVQEAAGRDRLLIQALTVIEVTSNLRFVKTLCAIVPSLTYINRGQKRADKGRGSFGLTVQNNL